MATFSKIPLSGSTNGKAIDVAATATAGTTLHVAVTGTVAFDEIWLYAANTSASAAKLTVEFGGTATKDNIELTVDAESGLVVVAPGLFLNNGLTIGAFADIPNVVSIHGYANRVE